MVRAFCCQLLENESHTGIQLHNHKVDTPPLCTDREYPTTAIDTGQEGS